MPNYWIVTCPVDRMRITGSSRLREPLWDHWYREKCVAIGFSPARSGSKMGRVNAMNRLKEVQIGDKVIPFTQKWSIGPVGTITAI
jgi:hypothetical protein